MRQTTGETAQRKSAIDGCGCAPSPAERREFWPVMSRRGALSLAALGIVTLAGIASPYASAAFAATYPSWDDVQAAKANEATKATEVQNIQGLIDGLTSEVARTKALAKQAADAFYTAQQEYFESSYRADSLRSQADAEAAKAEDAENKVGRVAAQLYRNGGDDTSMELFFTSSAASADDLLARLGTMDKLIERNQAVYPDAITARDSARSLSDQAVVARAERDRLQKVAEQKMVESQQAADAAQTALEAQTLHLGELQAQLAALRAPRRGRSRTTRPASRPLASPKNSAGPRNAPKPSVSPRQQPPAVAVAVAGAPWSAPAGRDRPRLQCTSGYGARSVQCGSGYCSSGFHYGVDLAAGCGSGIYAASAGRVVYAGYNGGYGNYVRLTTGGSAPATPTTATSTWVTANGSTPAT